MSLTDHQPHRGRKLGKMSHTNVEQLKARLAKKNRQRRSEALSGLAELGRMSHFLTSCIKDCNGEPGNGWEPELKEANRLVSLMYWKTVRVRELLEGRDTDGTDISIALFEADA